MAELKTKPTDASVEDFINSVENKTRREDSQVLLKLYKKVTGLEPQMWGTAIVGYGMYHYKSERSSQEGDWPLVAFSPRKQSLTLYVMRGFEGIEHLVEKLGKCKTSVGCLYINKLADVDMDVLEEIVKKSYVDAKRIFGEKK
ncbi:MAG: DUF1801 domain-containing protein [Candidatus Dojkabacteria bacterium]|nr:MAG: DUF1801 domain-containing protein [Candidatus Dojkabacteria bacterium]